MWPLLAQQQPGGFQQTIDTLARTPLSQIVLFVAACTVLRVAVFNFLKKTPAHHRTGFYPVAKFFNEAMDAIVYAGVFVFMLIRPFAVQAFLIPSGSMLQTLYVNDFIVANKAIYRYTEPKVGDIIVFKPPTYALNEGQHDVDFIKRCQGIPGDVVEVRSGKLWRNGKAIDEPYLSDSGRRDSEANGVSEGQGKDVQMDTDWKLVHYTGKARPDLFNEYIPVQIRRGVPPAEMPYNYWPIPGEKGMMLARRYAVAPDDISQADSNVSRCKSYDLLSPTDRQYEQELADSPPAAVPAGHVLMMGDNRNHSYDGRAWGLIKREDVIGRSEFIWLPIGRWRITR